MKEPTRFKNLKTNLLKRTQTMNPSYCYKKATEQVVEVQSWNPTVEHLVVYLDNFANDMFNDELWAKINAIPEIENENCVQEKLSVVLSKMEGSLNSCLMVAKNCHSSNGTMLTENYSTDLKTTLVNIINNDLLKFFSILTTCSIEHQLNVQIVLPNGKRKKNLSTCIIFQSYLFN